MRFREGSFLRLALWAVFGTAAILPGQVMASALFATTSVAPSARQAASAQEASRPWIKRSRIVTIEASALTGLDRAPGMKKGASVSLAAGMLTLNLFDDVSLQADMQRMEKTPSSNLVWHGIVGEDGEVVLARVGKAYSGAVSVNGSKYQIEPLANGALRIVEIDPDKQLSEAEPKETSAAPEVRAPLSSVAPQGSQNTDDGSVVDLLVTYNPTARDAAGGKDGIQSKIVAGVAMINDAFARSGVATRVNLVGMEEVNHGETYDVYAAEDWAKYDSGMHELRDKYAADLVFYVTRDGNNFGVVNPFLNSGNVVGYHATSHLRQDSLLDVGHFGHELGHLMGCDHAGDQYNYPGRAFYYFSYGYDGYPSYPYRTIVSKTATGSAGIPYYSSPYLSPYGFVIGASGGSRPADNVSTINLTRAYVAQFRNSADRNKVNIVPVISPLLL